MTIKSYATNTPQPLYKQNTRRTNTSQSNKLQANIITRPTSVATWIVGNKHKIAKQRIDISALPKHYMHSMVPKENIPIV